MEFLAGFSLIIPLMFISILILFFKKIISKELSVSIMYLMFIADGLFVMLWYYGLKDFLCEPKLFKLGISASFIFISMFRSMYFLIKQSID
jgi:hypothetical protein